MNLRTTLIAIGVLAASLSSAAGLPWAKDLKNAMAQAKSSKKVVMVDFTAVWCVNCHKLDRTTYVDPSVVRLLGAAVPVQIDFDKEQKLAKQYKITALPVILFIDASGKELGRISKYVDAKQFVSAATPILARAKKK
jgi:thiol:disulfide interchange protein